MPTTQSKKNRVATVDAVGVSNTRSIPHLDFERTMGDGRRRCRHSDDDSGELSLRGEEYNVPLDRIFR